MKLSVVHLLFFWCFFSSSLSLNEDVGHSSQEDVGDIGNIIWDLVWDGFLDWTLGGNFSSFDPPSPVANISCNELDMKWRRSDGSCNNLAHPGWGMQNSILRRLGNVAYTDGASEPRNVNARDLSNKIFGKIKPSVPPTDALTLMQFAMGQFFLHDLVLINMNYSEPLNIEFPSNDPHKGAMPYIPFWRAEHVDGTGTDPSNPRQYRNAVTQWIDLSTVYGSNEAATALLRANDGTGKLRMSNSGLHLPIATPADLEVIPMQVGFDTATPSAKTIYLAGDVRANQNFMVLAFHTLFAREHNRRCAELQAANPEWDDEQLFQKARQLTIAVWENILIHEFTYSFTDFTGHGLTYIKYLTTALESKYLSNLNPMAHVAWDILYRLHPSIASLMLCDDTFCSNPLQNISLTEMYFNAAKFNTLDFDTIFLGLANTPASNIGPSMDDDLRNVQAPVKGKQSTVFDLAAYDMQRMADLGVGSINDVRAIFNLKPVSEWEDISSEPDIIAALQSVYDSPASVDAFPGAMAEDHLKQLLIYKAAFGPTIGYAITFQAIVYSFTDRFFFLRPGWLTTVEVAEVLDTSLSDVILRNTNISCIPADVTYYRWNDNTNGPACGSSFDFGYL